MIRRSGGEAVGRGKRHTAHYAEHDQKLRRPRVKKLGEPFVRKVLVLQTSRMALHFQGKDCRFRFKLLTFWMVHVSQP